MRAITPVFSTLLIIILSVVLIGLFWFFITRNFSSLESSGTSAVGSAVNTVSSCMKIESVYGNQVSIRNCGKGSITADTLSVYLDDVPLNVTRTTYVKTFGETNILAILNHIYPGEMEGTSFSLGESAIVTGMSIYIKAFSGTANCKLVIYSDNSGAPQNLMGITNEISGIDTNWGWRNFVFSSSISLNPGVYWLMPMCNNDVNTEYDTSSPGYDLYGGTYPNFPNPWSSGSSYPFRESIYATYIPYDEIKPVGEYEVGTFTLSGLWNFNAGGHTLRIANPRVVTEAPVNAVSPDSAVLNLEFDEGSGTTVNDKSGYGNNGILYNSPNVTWNYGCKSGGCLAFNSTGVSTAGRVEIPNSQSLNTTGNQITVAAWVRPYNFTPGSPYGAIVWKPGAWGFGVGGGGGATNPLIQFYLVNSTGDQLLNWSTNSINFSVWSHLTLVYNGSYASIYINGKLDKSVFITGNIATNTNNVFIGQRTDMNRAFNGTIDSVRIYSQALTPDQMISLRPVSYD